MMATRGPKQNNIDLEAFIKKASEELFLPEETVNAVWNVFASLITDALLDEKKVTLRNFGVFRLGKTGRARFTAAMRLRQALKEMHMDKYGVELDNEAVLMAKVTGQCPTCQSALVSKDPPNCPRCGSQPFEKKKES